ncbi:hypothetical protein EV360DRAFT_90454 [Lentinula raphanica]|nr:hypothetical protein EV360DRAFT_90454 [Lentinula raphanica]
MPDLVLSSSQLLSLQSLLLSQGSDLSEDLRQLLGSFPTQLPHIPQFPRSRDRLIPRPSLPKKTCEASTQVELDLVISTAPSGFKPSSPVSASAVSTPPGPFNHGQDLPTAYSPTPPTPTHESPTRRSSTDVSMTDVSTTDVSTTDVSTTDISTTDVSTTDVSPTTHNSSRTTHSSSPTTHSSSPTTHDLSATTHDSSATTHDSSATTHDSSATAHNSLPTTHNSSPTTHNSSPTSSLPTVGSPKPSLSILSLPFHVHGSAAHDSAAHDSAGRNSPMSELQTSVSPTPEPPISEFSDLEADTAWAEEWDDVWEGGWDGELEGPEQLDDELAGDLDRDVEEMLLALLEGSSQRPMDTLASPSLASSSEVASSGLASLSSDSGSRKRNWDQLNDDSESNLPQSDPEPRAKCGRNGTSVSLKKQRVGLHPEGQLEEDEVGDQGDRDGEVVGDGDEVGDGGEAAKEGQIYLYEARDTPRVPPKETTYACLSLFIRLTGGTDWGSDGWAEDIRALVTSFEGSIYLLLIIAAQEGLASRFRSKGLTNTILLALCHKIRWPQYYLDQSYVADRLVPAVSKLQKALPLCNESA